MISSTATFSSVHVKVVRPVTGSDAEVQSPLFGLRPKQTDVSSPFVVELPDNAWFTPMHTRLERICKQMTGNVRTESLQQLRTQNSLDSSLVPSFSTVSARNITDPSPAPIRVGTDSWTSDAVDPYTDSVDADDDEQPANAPPIWLAQQSLQQRVQHHDVDPHGSATVRTNRARSKAKHTTSPAKPIINARSASGHPIMAGPCLSTLEVVQVQVQGAKEGVGMLGQALRVGPNAVATLAGVDMLGAGATAHPTAHRANTSMSTGMSGALEAPVWVVDTVDSFESSLPPAAQGLLNASNVLHIPNVSTMRVASAWRNDGYPDVPAAETGPSGSAYGSGTTDGLRGVAAKGERSRSNAGKTSVKSGRSSRIAAASIECMLNPALAMVAQGLDLADGRAVADEDAYGCALVEVARARAAIQQGSGNTAAGGEAGSGAGEQDAAAGLGHGDAVALAARVAVHTLSRLGTGAWAGAQPGAGGAVDMAGPVRAAGSAHQRKDTQGASDAVPGSSSVAGRVGAAAGEEPVEESELDAEVARYAQLRAEAKRSKWAAPASGHTPTATFPLEAERGAGQPPSAVLRRTGDKARPSSESKRKGAVAARLRAHGKTTTVSATDKLLLELEERGEALRQRRAKKASLPATEGGSDPVGGVRDIAMDNAGDDAGESKAETSQLSSSATSATLRDVGHHMHLPDASQAAAEPTNVHPVSPALSPLALLSVGGGVDTGTDADADAESLAWEAELRNIRNTAREREKQAKEASISELRAVVQEQNSWVEGLLRQVTGKSARVSLITAEDPPASVHAPTVVKQQAESDGEEVGSASVDHLLTTYHDTVQSATPIIASATQAALTAAAALAEAGLPRYRDAHQRLLAVGDRPGVVTTAATAAAPVAVGKARGGRTSAVPQDPSAPSRVVRVDVEQLLRRAALLTAQVAAFQQGDMVQYRRLLQQLQPQKPPQGSVSDGQPATQKRAVRGPNKAVTEQSSIAAKRLSQPLPAPHKTSAPQRNAITTRSGDDNKTPCADAVGESDPLQLRLAQQRTRVEEAQRMRAAALAEAAAEAESVVQRATEMARLRTSTSPADTNVTTASSTTLGGEDASTRELPSLTISTRPTSAVVSTVADKAWRKTTSTALAASAVPADEMLARRRLVEEREKKRAAEELLAQQQRARAEVELLKKKEEEEKERLRKKQADLEWTRQVDARRRQREEREKARLQKEAEEKRRLDALIEEEERRKKEERDRRMQSLFTLKKK